MFRALSTWHNMSFLRGSSSARTHSVYVCTHRCCFLCAWYVTTVRIEFTLPCYFSVTQYHEMFLNSLQTNCIFAALNYLVISTYFIIYWGFHPILWIQFQYMSLCDSTKLRSAVKTGHIFLCFLPFTNLPLLMRILSFDVRLHKKLFGYASKLYQWHCLFLSVHPLKTFINFAGVTSFLKTFVDHTIITNLSICKLITFLFTVDVELRQFASSFLDQLPCRAFFKIVASLLSLFVPLIWRPVLYVWLSSEFWVTPHECSNLLLILMMYFKTSSTDILILNSCSDSFLQFSLWKFPKLSCNEIWYRN